MPDILLTTFNARYAHASFGLRYLLANMGPLRDRGRAAILEFDIHQRPLDALEKILAHQPKIIGLGVYIWNVEPSTQLVHLIKSVSPQTTVAVGGPEVSYEIDQQEITRLADYVVAGEADLTFPQLCRDVLANRRPLLKVIQSTPPDMAAVALPYDLYSDEDLAHRVVYIEASRGCPFKCQFCLSSLDVPVRNVPLEPFLAAMDRLLQRGLRRFKFVDRTFNLNPRISAAILQFFLDRYTPGLFIHFEMIPDHLPDPLKRIIEQFPPGALQFEVGIQTLNETVANLIERKQNREKMVENVRFLRQKTGVHVHADLIAGLPGEDLPSFADGFNQLLALGPQEIQVGILKRLRGTPITRHDQPWQMVYSPHAPYEVLRTKLLDFKTLQRIRRFARCWDLIANSGNFLRSTPLIWTRPSGGQLPAFQSVMEFSDWLYDRAGQTHAIALPRLFKLLFDYLTNAVNHPYDTVAASLLEDYARSGRTDLPPFLRPHTPQSKVIPQVAIAEHPLPSTPPRQARHARRRNPTVT